MNNKVVGEIEYKATNTPATISGGQSPSEETGSLSEGVINEGLNSSDSGNLTGLFGTFSVAKRDAVNSSGTLANTSNTGLPLNDDRPGQLEINPTWLDDTIVIKNFFISAIGKQDRD